MRKPRIFVSSTCYDLGQVRDDLRKFIEDDLGYDAVLSEHVTFPVDPDKTTIDNSRSAVRDHADVFVLIVGGRYGTIDRATDRSITNGEYDEARAIGLPIYVFVLETVNTLFPAWQDDPGVSHPAVDSPRVFEFVQELKDSLIWVYPFKLAADIVTTLRTQWAYQFDEGLTARRLLMSDPEVERLGLHGEALNIALRRPELWEYALFVALLSDELEKAASLKRDLEIRFITQADRTFDTVPEFSKWARNRMMSMKTLLDTWKRVVKRVNEAFGPLGKSGDAREITYVASRLGSLYEAAIEWALGFYRVHIPDDAEKLRGISAKFAEQIIDSYPRLRDEFSRVIEQVRAGNLSGTIEIDWAANVPDGWENEFEDEVARLARKYGS